MRALFRRAPRGRCPECGRNVKLTRDGHVKRHPSTELGEAALWCSGRGDVPLSDRRHSGVQTGGVL